MHVENYFFVTQKKTAIMQNKIHTVSAFQSDIQHCQFNDIKKMFDFFFSFSFFLFFTKTNFSLIFQFYTKLQTTVRFKTYDRVAGEEATTPHNYNFKGVITLPLFLLKLGQVNNLVIKISFSFSVC